MGEEFKKKGGVRKSGKFYIYSDSKTSRGHDLTRQKKKNRSRVSEFAALKDYISQLSYSGEERTRLEDLQKSVIENA